MKLNWHIEELPIKQLKEHPKNPRQINKHNNKNLERQLQKFGLIDKPVVNTDYTVIGGHQRLRILKKMKTKTVECWVPDRELNEQEIDELCIGLNLHQGSWDYDILGNLWEPVDLLGYGFTEEQLLGISTDDLEEKEEKPSSKKKKCCPNCGFEL